MPNPAIYFIQKQKTINISGRIDFKPIIHPIIFITNKRLIVYISFISFIIIIYGQTNEKYKEDSRKSNTADRKPITYSRASNFGSKNEM